MHGPGRQLLFAAFLAVMIPVSAQAGKPAPLNCPAGTVLERIDKRPRYPLIDEVCRDFRSRTLEGPMRSLNPDGTIAATGQYRNDALDGVLNVYWGGDKLSKTVTYSRGIKVSEWLTRAGLEEVVRTVNASLGRKGANFRMEMIDDHTIGQTIAYPPLPPDVKPNPELLASLLRQNATTCGVFSTPSDLTRMVVRTQDTAGKEMGTVIMTRADCAQHEIPEGKR